MLKKRGGQSILLSNPVNIIATASIVGPKEGEGPLGKYFDKIHDDHLAGKESWEKAESEMARQAVNLASIKAEIPLTDFDYVIAGDLLNQSTGSTFGLRDINRPYLGIFGACSAMGEGMTLACALIDGGFAKNALAVASSHFCSAEKQFRFPLEFGSQRPPTSSWTVTGSAAVALSLSPSPVAVTACTTGKIVDMGITDANYIGCNCYV